MLATWGCWSGTCFCQKRKTPWRKKAKQSDLKKKHTHTHADIPSKFCSHPMAWTMFAKALDLQELLTPGMLAQRKRAFTRHQRHLLYIRNLIPFCMAAAHAKVLEGTFTTALAHIVLRTKAAGARRQPSKGGEGKGEASTVRCGHCPGLD